MTSFKKHHLYFYYCCCLFLFYCLFYLFIFFADLKFSIFIALIYKCMTFFIVVINNKTFHSLSKCINILLDLEVCTITLSQWRGIFFFVLSVFLLNFNRFKCVLYPNEPETQQQLTCKHNENPYKQRPRWLTAWQSQNDMITTCRSLLVLAQKTIVKINMEKIHFLSWFRENCSMISAGMNKC